MEEKIEMFFVAAAGGNGGEDGGVRARPLHHDTKLAAGYGKEKGRQGKERHTDCAGL